MLEEDFMSVFVSFSSPLYALNSIAINAPICINHVNPRGEKLTVL